MSGTKAFTLIEMLIYTSIFVVMAIAFLSILSVFTRIDTAQQATSEVASQATFVLQQVRRLVAASSAFEVKDVSGQKELWLYPQDYGTSPTKISKSGGAVTLSEAGAAAAPLTTSKVSVDSLSFSKFSNPPGPDVVQVDMTLSYAGTVGGGSESRTFRTAIARVSAATFDTDLVPSSDNAIDVGLAGTRWKNGVFSGGIGLGGAGVPVSPVKLEIDGGLRLNTVISKPSCPAACSSTRGTIWVTQGAAGTKDDVQVCAKDAANACAWRTIY